MKLKDVNKEHLNEEYWKETMKKRQPLCNEVDRLIMISKGYYFEELIYETKCKNKDKIDIYEKDFLYFVMTSKKPYGHQNIEISISYNLGWNWDLNNVGLQMPNWVIEEAKSVHKAVIERLKKERKEYLYNLKNEIRKNLS